MKKNSLELLLLCLCFWVFSANAVESGSEFIIPDVKLFNQHGEEVNFYSDLIKNKIVAINFIFTRCGMTCPLLGYKFGRLQKSLGERVGSEVYLISVSIDPVNDTPEKLKAWSEPFNKGEGWTQVTGSKQNVDYLLKALEAFAPDTEDHSTMVLMGDESQGEWKRLDGLSSAETLKTALSDWLPP